MSGPEFDLVLDTALGGVSPSPGPMDSRLLVELAARHGLAALVAARRPDDTDEGLRRVARAAQARSMAASAELVRLSAALSDAGIRHLAFKGPATATRLYGDVAARPFMDLDLLVDPDLLFQAADRVEQEGFGLDDRLQRAHLHRMGGKHLSHIKGPVRLELHREILGIAGTGRSFEELWQDRAAFELAGAEIPTLGRADLIHQNCLHGTGHAFLCLKWLGDVVRLARDSDGWEEALAWARRDRLEAAFLCGPALAADLGVSLPPELERAIRAGTSRQLSRLVEVCKAKWHLHEGEMSLVSHRLQMLPPSRRWRALATMALRPTASDWNAVPWLSPDTPIVFSILRPIRVAFKYGRRLLSGVTT